MLNEVPAVGEIILGDIPVCKLPGRNKYIESNESKRIRYQDENSTTKHHKGLIIR
jgi:hypothetical protein